MLNLEELILEQEGYRIDEKELLRSVGKFNYQSIKKLWGVIGSGAENVLVMDSETVAVRVFSLLDLFKRQEETPYYFFTPRVRGRFQESVCRSAARIITGGIDGWFFEYQNWFYSRTLVLKMREEVGRDTGRTLFQAFITEIPVFELQVYLSWLYRERPGVAHFIDSGEFVAAGRSLVKGRNVDESQQGAGLDSLEYLCFELDRSNLSRFSSAFEQLGLPFFKFDDRSGPGRHELLKDFVSETKSIVLLPCLTVSKNLKMSVDSQPIVLRRNYFPPEHIRSRIDKKLGSRFWWIAPN